ncbi:MAG: hypothetical protein AB7E72_05850 [Lysobacterales bacterium]
MQRSIGLWAACLLLLAPAALAATLTITLKNGRTVTYPMNEVERIVYADDGAGPGSTSHAETAAVAANWTGTWKTTDISIGRIALSQSGNDLSGAYNNGNGRITGTVNGGTFTGQWSEARSRRSGSMTLTLQPDGRTLKGTWSFSTSPNTKASFTATRE